MSKSGDTHGTFSNTETITESEWVRRKFAEIERRLEEMRRLINEPTGDSFKTNKRGGIGEG